MILDWSRQNATEQVLAHASQIALPLVMYLNQGYVLDEDLFEKELSRLYKPIKRRQLREALSSTFKKNPSPHVGQASPGDLDAPEDSVQVLLAEDNHINQKVATKFLERFGLKPDIANNGMEVLSMIEKKQYDLILMDINMPEMDGMETTKKIRANPLLEQQPYIVAMTANAMQGDEDLYLSSGMDEYISKPIKISALEDAVNRIKAKKHKSNLKRVW